MVAGVVVLILVIILPLLLVVPLGLLERGLIRLKVDVVGDVGSVICLVDKINRRIQIDEHPAA